MPGIRKPRKNLKKSVKPMMSLRTNKNVLPTTVWAMLLLTAVWAALEAEAFTKPEILILGLLALEIFSMRCSANLWEDEPEQLNLPPSKALIFVIIWKY